MQRHGVEGNNIIHSGANSFMKLDVGEHEVTDTYRARYEGTHILHYRIWILSCKQWVAIEGLWSRVNASD